MNIQKKDGCKRLFCEVQKNTTGAKQPPFGLREAREARF